MSFEWAADYPDLQLVCKTFGCYELDEPDRYCYRPIASITQQGPQCGLVALAMCTPAPTRDLVNEIFTYARDNGMTRLGEMFSVDLMHQLAERFVKDTPTEIYKGALNACVVIEHLMHGATLLVPYDCDRNHTPMKQGGRKAHWAIIFGVVESYAGVYVIAKQGKSLNVHIWDLDELAASNQQLFEYDNERINDAEWKFVIPEGGVGGTMGLCGRAVLIHPREFTKTSKFEKNS